MKPPQLSESAIQRQIIEAAKVMGHKVYRTNAGRIRARNGWLQLAEEGTPDLLVVKNLGRSLWVEVKNPGEHATEIQKKRHRELRSLGHAVVVACSVEEFRVSVEEVCSLRS
jgi:hypothetical protein